MLWPDGGPQIASPDVLEAQEHLASCIACRRFVDDMLQISIAVGAAAPRSAAAPAELRERLFTALARARVGSANESGARRARSRSALIAVGAVVLLLVSGTWLYERWPRASEPDMFAVLAEDHGRVSSGARIVSSDTGAVARWIGARVPFAMYVPELPGARLRGARLVLFAGRRGAVAEYDVNGSLVSYFVLPAASPLPAADGRVRFEHNSRAGYGEVAWQDAGLLHVMVGTLPLPRLEQFARDCIAGMSGAVARLGPRAARVEGEA
ncbi:MAG: hypothetical protein ABIP93_19085 [Gemmatimonadaceae bacterium]